MATIQTTKGHVDEALLKKQTGATAGAFDSAAHTEYWQGGDPKCTHTFNQDAKREADGSHVCLTCGAHLVKRDVTTQMKKGVAAVSVAAKFK